MRPAPQGAFRLQGKEVVFFEAEWPGFEPRTSSIRRGRSIHSATPHLAHTRTQLYKLLLSINPFLANASKLETQIKAFLSSVSNILSSKLLITGYSVCIKIKVSLFGSFLNFPCSHSRKFGENLGFFLLLFDILTSII